MSQAVDTVAHSHVLLTNRADNAPCFIEKLRPMTWWVGQLEWCWGKRKNEANWTLATAYFRDYAVTPGEDVRKESRQNGSSLANWWGLGEGQKPHNIHQAEEYSITQHIFPVDSLSRKLMWGIRAATDNSSLLRLNCSLSPQFSLHPQNCQSSAGDLRMATQATLVALEGISIFLFVCIPGSGTWARLHGWEGIVAKPITCSLCW